jgi:Ser/Thr protein kinase RdoA (MazF antagonist)
MRPRDPAFGAVAADLARAIKASVPGLNTVERLLTDAPEDGGGRFFRAMRRGGAPVFLKLMSAADYDRVAEIAAILAPLAGECYAACPTGVFPLTDGSSRIAVAYRYVDGRYLAPSPAEMKALGRKVALLHRKLRDLPDRDRIRVQARERARVLDAILRARGRDRALLDAAAIPALTACVEESLEGPAAQPLHGDLNVGNILYERHTGDIHFLDFEDVRHTCGPPLLDLALPIERFCLLMESESQAKAGACALLGGYAECAGASPIGSAGALAQALRAINERAVALLILRQNAGLRSPPGEWRKFGELLLGHARRRALIADIERSVL